MREIKGSFRGNCLFALTSPPQHMGGWRQRERKRERRQNKYSNPYWKGLSKQQNRETERDSRVNIVLFFFSVFFPGMQSVWAASSLGRPTDEECISAVVNNC